MFYLKGAENQVRSLAYSGSGRIPLRGLSY